MINRIFDFERGTEDDITSRILVYLHKVIDENFPSAMGPPKKFSQTVLNPYDEKTASNIVNNSAFAGSGFTSTDLGNDPALNAVDMYTGGDSADLNFEQDPGSYSYADTEEQTSKQEVKNNLSKKESRPKQPRHSPSKKSAASHYSQVGFSKMTRAFQRKSMFNKVMLGLILVAVALITVTIIYLDQDSYLGSIVQNIKNSLFPIKE